MMLMISGRPPFVWRNRP